MNNWPAEAWRAVVESAPDGVVICDATSSEHPVVYVNAAFVQMCGYPAAALLGTNLRILQGTDRDQEARARFTEAVSKGEPARVLVRNYRPDGTMFWNESVIHPVRNAGTVTHFIGYHRDASDRLKHPERLPCGLPSWLREDRLTGLHSRAYFEELLLRDWQLAQRDSHEIGLTLFDIDDLGAYNEKFDRSAGDACIRRIARVIGASYRRGGDLVGRWEGGTFVVLTQGEAAEKATQYAQVVRQRVRDLLMHHPTAGAGRYVTLSAGIASLVPPRTLALEGLLNACRAALRRAKKNGKDGLATAEAADFQESQPAASETASAKRRAASTTTE
ncbi:MAG: diguanylate cyclase [Gammaproteobacteria bacterium]|nr:diguanylate cyclase [Gammaproteobacteria bacterium]MBV8974512.1 diguanylate cyclase [Nevskiaceae bacterium]MBV9724040.1 diguanylate cyclase [Gammaproteobacteria bacterium]